MVALNNAIILIDNIKDLEVLGIKQRLSDSKLFSFDYEVHKALEKNSIIHEIGDLYLSRESRLELFELSLKLADGWYKNIPFIKEFELNGVNLFGLFDTFELQQYLIHIMIRFLTIKKILDKEKPSKVIVTTNFSRIIKSLLDDKEIEIETYENSIPPPLLYDKIEIMFSIGRIPISFHISRSTYLKIKGSLESMVGKLFNLWVDLKDNKKTILFLEINPSSYIDLISNLKITGSNILFLNKRRPAIWNLKSIHTLHKYGCKLPNTRRILNEFEKSQVMVLKSQIFTKMKKIWSDDKMLEKLFLLDGYSFWPVIRDTIIKKYEERMMEYIDLLTISQKLLQGIKFSCIFLLYEIGETEKAIIGVNKNKIPSIVHQHGFDNLTKNLAKYDPLNIIPLKSDKIAVYGELNKNYLHVLQNIDQNRILVSGSPRHDPFFKKKLSKTDKKKKIILITPLPISEFTAQPTTDLYVKFENSIEKLLSAIKNISDVKAIVKLHPSREFHNEEIKKLFKKLDPTIPIYQMNPIIDLLEECDILVNIQPESYNSSTVIMEAFILNKPVMNIFLDDQYHDIEFVKDHASLVVSENSDFEKNLNDILFNEQMRENLVLNGKKHLQKFLVNHGTASQYLSKIISSY